MNNPSVARGRRPAGARRWAWHFSALVAVGGALVAGCSSGSKDGTGSSVATALTLTVAPPATFANRATITPAPAVQVVDANGAAVSLSGITVTAGLFSGSGALSGTVSVPTDAQGVATFNNLSIAGATGPKTIQFTATGLTAATTGTLTLTAGAPSSVAANSTPAATGLTGSAVATLPAVKVTDLDNNPVPGVTVTFAVTAGGGNVTGATPATDVAGVATVGSWTLGNSSGVNTVSATVAALTPVNFNVTAGQAGVAAALQVSTQPPTTVASRAGFGTAPVVQLVDVVGGAVNTAGTAVTVALQGGGTLGGTTTVNTDAAGQATFAGLSIAGTVGNKQLQFASGGLVGATSNAIALTPGPAANIVANSAVNQSGFAGTAVSTLPSVKVTDLDANGVSGVGVTFAVTQGGGMIAGATPTTNTSGVATLGSWTLGVAPGTNTVTASGTSLTLNGAPLAFNASGNVAAGNFTITLQSFGPAISPTRMAAFNNAKARWEQVITGDLADVTGLTNSGAQCGNQNLPSTIDDVVILFSLDSIDGPGQILGAAGPCFIRQGANAPLTIVGIMKFDTADVAQLEANGQLNDVILHEMGHVLGYGTLWTQPPFAFLTGACSTAPTFIGPNAVAAYTGSNGGGSATSVPVENFPGSPPTCPNGTRDSHWEEDVFRSEVMTGFISGVVRPLSLTSIMSLKDLGYTVNAAAADPFNINTQPTLRAPGGVEPPVADLHNDILRIPLYSYDSKTGTIRMVRAQ